MECCDKNRIAPIQKLRLLINVNLKVCVEWDMNMFATFYLCESRGLYTRLIFADV